MQVTGKDRRLSSLTAAGNGGTYQSCLPTELFFTWAMYGVSIPPIRAQVAQQPNPIDRTTVG